MRQNATRWTCTAGGLGFSACDDTQHCSTPSNFKTVRLRALVVFVSDLSLVVLGLFLDCRLS